MVVYLLIPILHGCLGLCHYLHYLHPQVTLMFTVYMLIPVQTPQNVDRDAGVVLQIVDPNCKKNAD